MLKSLLTSLLSILILVLTLPSCSQNLDPNTPDGTMRIFAKDFANGKHELLYDQLTDKTRQQLGELIVLFQKRLKLASTYPEAQQAWAKKDLDRKYDGMNDPKALFLLLIKDDLSAIKDQPADEIEQYFNAKSVQSNAENPDKAYVITRTNDRIDLMRENGSWKIASFEALTKRLIDQTQEGIEVMDKNLKEIKRRQELNLALPSNQ